MFEGGCSQPRNILRKSQLEKRGRWETHRDNGEHSLRMQKSEGVSSVLSCKYT